MDLTRKSTAVLAAACVSLGAAAPFALADQPSTSPNGPKTTTTTTEVAPTAPTAAEKRQGYGVLCKGVSKKRIADQQGTGTPFSRCVKALAKVDADPTVSAKKACKTVSKKRAQGQKHSPFVLCVKAANQQRKLTQQAATPQAAPAS